jgi:SAM-dependent methyltransferase
MEYRIESGTDPKFKQNYEAYMLRKCEKDKLPNPHNAKHGIFHNYRPWEYEKVQNYANFKIDDVVLDTGAMHTYFCIFLSQFIKKIYVTDNFYWANRDYMKKENLFSPEKWIEYIEEKGEGKIKGENADLMNLQYQDNTFDKVFCISTIEHVLDDFQAIKELSRVLKKGGKLILTTEFNFHIGKKYSEKDNSYYRVYNLKSLEKLIDNSGLKLNSPALIEKRNYLYLRKHVNVSICLEK